MAGQRILARVRLYAAPVTAESLRKQRDALVASNAPMRDWTRLASSVVQELLSAQGRLVALQRRILKNESDREASTREAAAASTEIERLRLLKAELDSKIRDLDAR